MTSDTGTNGWSPPGVNPLVHYLSYGVKEGRKPNPLFDTKYYLEKNPEVTATSENPLAHYLEKGAVEGKDPGPDFDTLEAATEHAIDGGKTIYTITASSDTNGVITPSGTVTVIEGADHFFAGHLEELQRAIKSDLLAIQRTLQLRCPVTALITGLEEERGFSELVRRVGPERAGAQRFGRKFDVRSLATPEELIALCDHVCGAFDDWVYALFREQGALTRPGNTRLYALLCRVRCHLKPRLTELLSSGFGYDRRELPDDDPFLFSGCYFAATGSTPDRQAFVRGVLEKLAEEQEYVEWSPQALAANRRLLWLSYAGLAVCAVLLVTLAAMLVGRGF